MGCAFSDGGALKPGGAFGKEVKLHGGNSAFDEGAFDKGACFHKGTPGTAGAAPLAAMLVEAGASDKGAPSSRRRWQQSCI